MIFKPITAGSVALTLLAPPAFAQTETTTQPALPSTQDTGDSPSQDGAGQNSSSMRQMMREMMIEMMHNDDRDGGRREWRKGDRRQHAERMGPRGDDGMGRRMMHGTGMRMISAIVDADGDGALSLAEIQDFHGRIFRAIDKNKDGKVEMIEIELFFHGPKGEVEEDEEN